jgi:hypothetical protein
MSVQPPTGRITGELTDAERARLIAAELDPATFAVFEQPCVQVAGQSHQTPQGAVMVFSLVTVIPASMLDLPTSRIVTADGQEATPERLRAALPVASPPMVRIVARRDLLSPTVRAQLALAETHAPEADTDAAAGEA